MRQARQQRPGATVVECAFVYPVFLLLVLGLLVGAAGIFRYSQLASLTREAARYASVHGGQYAQETGNPAATADDIYKNAILPYAVNLDPANLAYTVSWDTDNMPYHMTDDYEKPLANTVTVTVRYTWLPEVYLVDPVTQTSSSTMTMSY